MPDDDGRILYRIYQKTETGEPAIHSQGGIEFAEPAESRHDPDALRAACGMRVATAEQCYAAFAAKGLMLGASFRAIREIHVGDQQALARLELPDALADQAGRFVLHPSMMDGALQASMGLLIAAGEVDTRLGLPFALERLEILAPTTARMWSYVRFSAGSQASDRVQKLDFDLCDDAGRVCVRFVGLS
ncbi:hypothetical protein BW685_23365, partial [Burkholderia ubonensis]